MKMGNNSNLHYIILYYIILYYIISIILRTKWDEVTKVFPADRDTDEKSIILFTCLHNDTRDRANHFSKWTQGNLDRRGCGWLFSFKETGCLKRHTLDGVEEPMLMGVCVLICFLFLQWLLAPGGIYMYMLVYVKALINIARWPAISAC